MRVMRRPVRKVFIGSCGPTYGDQVRRLPIVTSTIERQLTEWSRRTSRPLTGSTSAKAVGDSTDWIRQLLKPNRSLGLQAKSNVPFGGAHRPDPTLIGRLLFMA